MTAAVFQARSSGSVPHQVRDALAQFADGPPPMPAIAAFLTPQTDEFQQWDLETYDQGGLEPQWPTRLHAVSDDFCAYTDFTGAMYGTIGNCDLAGTESGRKVGVYAYGDFTGTPLAP